MSYDLIRKLITSGTPDELVTEVLELFAEVRTYRKRLEADLERKRRERSGECGHPRLPEKEWVRLTAEVLKRDSYVCAYCGDAEENGTKLCADHIVPLSRGGSNEPDNLCACCILCNSSKSNRLLTEWRGRGQ